MRRREFIAGLAGTAALAPHLLKAQDAGRTYRIAVIANTPRNVPIIHAFFDELRLNGFVEGQNLVVTVDGFGFRDNQIDRLVDEVVEVGPDVVVASELPTRALQRRSTAIPIVAMTEDMVASGLVAALARPGGNTTGISLLSRELDGKRLEILAEAVPSIRKMAAIADSQITPLYHKEALQAAARTRGIELSVIGITGREEVLPAINAAHASGAQAINFLATPLTFVPRASVFARVAELRLPAIYQWPEMAEEGGLVGYGPRFVQVWRQRARLLVKVLRGTRPADLPVEQPTRFELVVNLETAKAIGHDVPASLVLRADRVIE